MDLGKKIQKKTRYKGANKMEKKNELNMVSDNELEQVAGGNAIEKTVKEVANNDVVDYVVDTVTDAVSEAYKVLKYIWEH